jgi:hypothetical protein
LNIEDEHNRGRNAGGRGMEKFAARKTSNKYTCLFLFVYECVLVCIFEGICRSLEGALCWSLQPLKAFEIP